MKSSAVPATFERRAARAETLAQDSSAARQPLTFAAGLYRAQGAVAEALQGARLAGQLERDLESARRPLRELLRFAVEQGPPELAQAAQARGDEDPRARLAEWWRGGGSGRDDYLSRALLRPYAELLAAQGVRPERPGASGGCPFCGGPPWIAARKSTGDADGAQRILSCALCGSEWALNRIHCVACEEQSPEKLSSFQSERYPAVRIETCATCHTYVKSIDLTLDARAIPEVDDLLSLSMDLWAGEQGYARLEPGLAGL